MRINKVAVRNLFNRFDYDLDFRNDDNISIFIGGNASGKSTILNFISFMFEPSFEKYLAIEMVPFSSFSLELDNGLILHLDYLGQENFSDKYYEKVNRIMDTWDIPLIPLYTGADRIFNDGCMKRAEYISNLRYYITEGKKTVKCQQTVFASDLSLDTFNEIKALFCKKNYWFAEYYNHVSKKANDLEKLYQFEKFDRNLTIRKGQLTCQFDVRDYSEKYYQNALKKGWEYCTELFPFSIATLIYAMEEINRNLHISKRINHITASRIDKQNFQSTMESLNNKVFDLFGVFRRTLRIVGDRISSKNTLSKDESFEKNAESTRNTLKDNYNHDVEISEEYEYIIYSCALYYLGDHQDLSEEVLRIADRAAAIPDISKTESVEQMLAEYYETKQKLVDLEIVKDYKEYSYNSTMDVEVFACYYFAVGIFNILLDKLAAFLNVNNLRLKENGKKLVFEYRDNYGLFEYGLSSYCFKVKYLYDSIPSFNVEKLSSGEKNDLVIFYNLLFEIDSNDLLIVDEPEISQHIELQELFIDELIDIVSRYNRSENSSLQAIVATHSPHVLNGHYNLLINKKVNSRVELDNE